MDENEFLLEIAFICYVQIILWVTGPKCWETILTKYYIGKKQCVTGEYMACHILCSIGLLP